MLDVTEYEHLDGYDPSTIPEDREFKTQLTCQIKAEDVDNKGTFKGYAAWFGNLDSWDDVIVPGAFKKTLRQDRKDVKILYQHDSWTPIGLPISMEEDDKGLLTEGELHLDYEPANQAHILLKGGLIDKLSIGFSADPKKQKFVEEDGKRIRYLQEIKLWEYSLVTFAANPKAKILSVKAARDPRQLERILIEQWGFSHKAAKYLASRHRFDALCDAAVSEPSPHKTHFDALCDAAASEKVLRELCDCLKHANRTIFST